MMLITRQELDVLQDFLSLDTSNPNIFRGDDVPFDQEEVLESLLTKIKRIKEAKKQGFPIPGQDSQTPGHRHKLLVVDEYFSPLIRGALKDRLTRVKVEVEWLKLCNLRDLTADERTTYLPENLRAMTQEELQEQINPWISLQMAYESLIEDYVFPEEEDKQPPK